MSFWGPFITGKNDHKESIMIRLSLWLSDFNIRSFSVIFFAFLFTLLLRMMIVQPQVNVASVNLID